MERFNLIFSIIITLLIFQLSACTNTTANETSSRYLDSSEKSFAELQEAAKSGNLNAQYKLAECYEYGIETEQDELIAFKLYKDAHKKGSIEATYKLAKCYEYAIGTKKNEHLAYNLYRIALKNGYEEACYDIDKFYANNL